MNGRMVTGERNTGRIPWKTGLAVWWTTNVKGFLVSPGNLLRHGWVVKRRSAVAGAMRIPGTRWSKGNMHFSQQPQLDTVFGLTLAGQSK